MKYKILFVIGLSMILAISGTAFAFASGTHTDETDLLEENLDEIYSEISTAEGYPFPDEYPTVDQLYEWYDVLEEEFDIVEKHHYGHSYEGRDLWALEITSDEDTQVDNKPGVLIDGALHAREWSSVQVSSYLMWRLVEEYETNETIYWLVNNRRIFIVPMTNPDGYIYDGDGDLDARQGWRRNRNVSVGDEDDVGVDLNRNWDVNFGGRGASDDPGSDPYHGEKSFSEPETYHLKEFLLEMDVNSYQNIHSHADTLLIPYMHTNDPSPHDDWYRGMADHMVSLTSMLGDESEQYSYGKPQEEIGYSASGGASDWAYAKEGMQGLTFEIYTPESGLDGFYPDEEYIMTINKDLDDSLMYQVRAADVELGDGPMGEGGDDLFPPVPYLVYGCVEVGGAPVPDVEVDVVSQETGEQLSLMTDSNGYYEFNFGNLVEHGYDIGDEFILDVDSENGADKQVDLTVDDTLGKRIDLEFFGETHELTLDIQGEGEVEVSPDQEEYLQGTEVTLTAVPEDDWRFVEWTGDAEGTEEEVTITMDEDKEITAAFEEVAYYTLNVDVEGEGTVEIDPDEEAYIGGTEVTLTAIPDEGHEFVEWIGPHEGTEEEITVLMDGDKEIKAVFREEVDRYELTLNIDGEGTVEVEGEEVKDGETLEIEEGKEIELEAIPDEDWHFVEWTGDAEGKEEGITIYMENDKDVTAYFQEEAEMYQLTIDILGEGEVTVEFNDKTYEFNDSWSGEIEEDMEVNLTAEPSEDWRFEVWSGIPDENRAITLTLEEDMELTARFLEEDDEDDDTPGFTFVLLILSVAVVVAIYYNKEIR